MKKILLTAAAVVAFATPVQAQENNFDGFRVEGRLGYDWFSLDADYTDALGSVRAENNESGFTFGAEAGYDFPVSANFTLGIYGGVDFTSNDVCRTISSVDQACLELKRNLYIGGRAGYQVGASSLIYAKAGYTNGRAEIEFNDDDDVVDDLVDSDSRDGWHLGAGWEQNFGPGFYGKLEFVYIMYSDIDFSNADQAVTFDGDRTQIMAGAGLRF